MWWYIGLLLLPATSPTTSSTTRPLGHSYRSIMLPPQAKPRLSRYYEAVDSQSSSPLPSPNPLLSPSPIWSPKSSPDSSSYNFLNESSIILLNQSSCNGFSQRSRPALTRASSHTSLESNGLGTTACPTPAEPCENESRVEHDVSLSLHFMPSQHILLMQHFLEICIKQGEEFTGNHVRAEIFRLLLFHREIT